jgi:hypothetical protein
MRRSKSTWQANSANAQPDASDVDVAWNLSPGAAHVGRQVAVLSQCESDVNRFAPCRAQDTPDPRCCGAYFLFLASLVF